MITQKIVFLTTGHYCLPNYLKSMNLVIPTQKRFGA